MDCLRKTMTLVTVDFLGFDKPVPNDGVDKLVELLHLMYDAGATKHKL